MIRISWSKSLLAGLFVFASVSPVHAKIAVGESLDWLVVSRKHIAIAEVMSVQGDIAMRIKKTLKGEPPEKANVGRDGAAPAQATEFLLFFNEKKEVDYSIDLASPMNQRVWGLAFAMDFRVLEKREAILEAVDKRLARLKKDPPRNVPTDRAGRLLDGFGKGYLVFEAPQASAVYKTLWSESAVYLIVPADAEFKKGLIEGAKSKDVHERARSAYRLANYPGDETTRILRELLKDDGTSVIQVSGGNQTRNITVYPARQAAYDALTSLGIETPKPEGYYPGLGLNR